MRRRALALLTLPLLALGAGCGDDDDDGGVAAGGGDFCDKATQVEARFNELDESFGGTELPSSDVFEQAADAIGELADDAPDEIDGDLEVVAEGVREIAEIFGDIDLSDPEALADPENAAALQAMGERMEELDEKVSESSDRVEAYLRDECGIDMDGDDGTDDGTDETDGS